MQKLIVFFLLILASSVHSQTVWMTPNRGQWDNRILYNIDVNQGKMYLENDGMTFYLSDVMAHNHSEDNHVEHKEGYKFHVIHQKLLGANLNSNIQEQNQSTNFSNYILGNLPSKWKSKVYSYSKVNFQEIYDGISLIYKGENEQLSYNFEIEKGKDPSIIRYEVEGTKDLIIDKNGILHLKHRFGEIIQSAPIAWTENELGEKTKVACQFNLKNNILSFEFPNDYNKNEKLIIDPSLTFATFTGSTADNWGFTATPDINGNLFGGGIVFGSGYPTSSGAYDVSFNSGTGSFPMDVGITKYNASGTNIIFSTYIGGSGNETPHSIVCAPNGELYIYGATSSSNFPMAGTPYDNSFNGGPSVTENSLEFNGADIYVARLSANGTQLLASTFVGGSGTDGLNTNSLHYNYGDQFRGEITLDANQNVYISSTTASSNFPTTSGNQTSIAGNQDAVIFKLPPNLSALTWSTYFGGEGLETGNSITVSANGTVYVAGGTTSSNLPITSGNDLSFNGGLSDGYVVRKNGLTGATLSGTYMGMNEYDQTYFVQTDIDNFVYVYGQTESSWQISPGCFGTPNSGQFIRKYTQDLINVPWTTMIGGGHGHVEISPTAFLVSNCYDIYLAGWGGTLNSSYGQATYSTSSGFACTPGAFQSSTNGSNFYLAVLSQDAATLKYATYMGGMTGSHNHVDGGTSRFDKSGRIYHAVCGACGGNPNGFTSTPGSWSPTNESSNCNMATFKFELSSIDAAAAQPEPLICIPQSVYFQNNSTNGNAYYWDFGDGNSSTDFEPIYQYTTPGSYNVELIVYDTSGCYSSDSVTVTVNVGAFAGGVIQPSTPICPGGSYQFDAYGGSTYSWSPANLLNNPNVSNPTATIQTTTTFTVVISDSCGSQTLSVVLPVINNTLTLPPDTSICLGGNIQLNAVGNGTISWSPSTFLNNINSFNPIAIPDSSITYTATLTSPEGCILVDSTSISVFFSLPISNLPDTMEMCKNSQIGILNSGGDGYLWSPNEFIDTVNGPLVTVNPPTEKWYYCQVSNACGFVMDSVLIQIVEANITAGNDTIICPRQTATLWANGALSYQWIPFNTVVSQNGNFVEVRPSVSTNYAVIGTDLNGCYDTAYVEVGLYSYPSLSVTSDVYAFFDDQIQLEAITHIPGTITWTPAEYLSCTNCPNPIATPNQEVTYYVYFTDVNGCKNSSYVNIYYDATIYVPNTFIPNNDGINDVFRIYGGNLKDMECLIFNRWGELIKTLNSTEEFWDGTYRGRVCQDGTYTWKLTYVDFLNHKHQLTGHVNLLK